MKRWLWLLVVLVWAGSALALPFESAVTRGNRSYHKAEYEKAEETYKKANEKKKTALLKFNLGDALYKQGKFGESETLFSALTSLALPKATPQVAAVIGRSYGGELAVLKK